MESSTTSCNLASRPGNAFETIKSRINVTLVEMPRVRQEPEAGGSADQQFSILFRVRLTMESSTTSCNLAQRPSDAFETIKSGINVTLVEMPRVRQEPEAGGVC